MTLGVANLREAIRTGQFGRRQSTAVESNVRLRKHDPKTHAFLGNREIGGHTFKFNPESVEWAYTQNTRSTDTLGGRVIQLLSARVEGMTVSGSAGSKKELQRLASNVAAIMHFHRSEEQPVSFKVPSRDWHFKVYVKRMPRIGWDNRTIRFPFSLEMEVVEDLGIKTPTILTDELERLKKNIGYDPKWHGGDINNFIEVMSSLGDDTDGATYSGSKSGVLSDEEIAELVVEVGGWDGQEAIIAVAIVIQESQGDVDNYNGSCCWGLWQIHVEAHSVSVKNATDPEWSTKFARGLYDARKERKGWNARWDDWEAYTGPRGEGHSSGNYRLHLDRARRAVSAASDKYSAKPRI